MSSIIWKFIASNGGIYDFGADSNPESHQNILGQRLGEIEVPRRHGVSIQAATFTTARQVTLRGTIAAMPGETVINLRNRMDDFSRGMLAAGRGKLYEWDNRYIWATAQNIALSYPEGAGMLVADFSVDFLCDDPFIYSTIQVVTSAIITGNTAWSLWVNNVDNTGEASWPGTTPPIIAFRVLAGGLTWCSATLGSRTFSWAKTPGLVANQALNVDMATKDVFIGTIAGWPLMGISDRTGLATTADFFDLEVGTNTIGIWVSHTCDVAVYHRPRWP